MTALSKIERRIMAVFWAVALVLGAVQAWTSRFDMAPDGIQYLDNADAYLRGDWKNAANTYWSPMYSWLLGAGLKILNPGPYWEFAVVHLVNFLVYVCVLAAFQGFLFAFLARTTQPGTARTAAMAVACSAFLYATLGLTNLQNASPDLTMAVFVFILATLVIRITSGDRRMWTFCAFGLTLGFGYLAKVPFFIFAMISFAVFAVMVLRRRIRMLEFVVAIAAFSVVAVPYVAFLTVEKGRLTYGDSARYNLIWMVNSVPYYHWQGGPEGSGKPVHPTRQIADHPPVFEFADPIHSTYPPWYDPIYWHEGARVRYSPGDFLRSIVRNTRGYFWLFHYRQTPLICGLLILFLLARKRAFATELAALWPLLFMAVFPFAMYGVVHTEGRFLGAFFVILWSSVFAAAIVSARDFSPGVVAAVCFTVASLMLIEAALVTIPTPPLTGPQDADVPLPARDGQQQIALALARAGVRPGDQAAIVGNVSADFPYDWARLARVRIVAQALPSGVVFDPKALPERAEEWDRARETLRHTTARFVIAPAIPGIVDQHGWERVGSTQAFIYRLLP